MARISVSTVAAVLLVAAGGCSSMESPGGGSGGSPGLGGGIGAGAAVGTAGAGGGTGGQFSDYGGATGTGGQDAGPGGDAEFCCPPDASISGCMHLGGVSSGGACYLTCDFWCSSNWRIQQDSHGCPVWRYDFNSCALDAGDARHD
jgi:hypothetical protein